MVEINLSDSIYSTCAIRFFILYFHQLVIKITRLRGHLQSVQRLWTVKNVSR